MTAYRLPGEHAKGLALTLIGGLTLSLDIPLVRLAGGDYWTILFLRSTMTLAAALSVWLALRLLRGSAPVLLPGRAGLAVAGLYGVASVLFMLAVFNTSTANLVFILAFNTMFSTVLSWLLLRERPHPATLATMAMMTGGVLIIVFDGLGSGHFLGNLFALASTFVLATAITFTRASGRDMGFAALVAVVLPMTLGGLVVSRTGLHVAAPLWILLNGAVVMPISFFCLASGPRYISAPEVSMFYLLETVLAPVWVWLIFAETPSRAALIGGTILITALVAHAGWQLNRVSRRRAGRLSGHPI